MLHTIDHLSCLILPEYKDINFDKIYDIDQFNYISKSMYDYNDYLNDIKNDSCFKDDKLFIGSYLFTINKKTNNEGIIILKDKIKELEINRYNHNNEIEKMKNKIEELEINKCHINDEI